MLKLTEDSTKAYIPLKLTLDNPVGEAPAEWMIARVKLTNQTLIWKRVASKLDCCHEQQPIIWRFLEHGENSHDSDSARQWCAPAAGGKNHGFEANLCRIGNKEYRVQAYKSTGITPWPDSTTINSLVASFPLALICLKILAQFSFQSQSLLTLEKYNF